MAIAFKILGFLIFWAYIVPMVNRKGVQPSISFSFYRLPFDRKFAFRLYILSFVALLAILGYEPLYLIGAAFLSLVAIFPRVKTKWKKVIHMIGATVGIGLG